LITLGCFSECWDDNNKPETTKLIQYFLQRGNQIQLATKKEITIEEAKKFEDLIKYWGQLVIFVSSATISQWNKVENGTDSPNKRFNTFEITSQLGIPTVLYMKPVLKGITIKDMDLYRDVIKKYGIRDVVVGSIFSEEHSKETVHFSNKNLLFYNPNLDESHIKNKLLQMENVRVFSRSSQVMQYYKEKSKDIER
jgi:DNA repair photolyase